MQKSQQNVLVDSKISHIGYIFDTKRPGNEAKIGCSIYKEQMGEKEIKNIEKHTIDLHKANFIFGYDESVKKSESHEKYGHTKSEDSKNNMELKNLLKKNHFEYRHEGQKPDELCSIAKTTYVNTKNEKMLDEKKGLLKEREYLKQTHFELGRMGKKTELITQKQLGFKYDKKSEPAALSKEQQKDLRKEHFIYGQDSNNWNSVYREKFSPKK